MDRRNVLVVGIAADTYQKIAPLLQREDFEVDRFPGATGALELLASVTFRALIVGYPLADTKTEAFLAAIRAPGSLSLRTPLVLVAEPAQLDAATALVGRGANRVVSLEESEQRLQREVSELLAVAPRAALREMLRLELRLGDERTLVLCQTHDVSSTGMLVRTERRFPLGTEIGFELTLSGDPRGVRGRAQVVRHTMSGRDPVSGMALRFLAFESDGLARFVHALTRA